MLAPPPPDPQDEPTPPPPTRPPSLFRVWLGYFVVSTALTYVVLFLAAAMVIDPDEGGVGPVVTAAVLNLLIPVPITFLTFHLAVARYVGSPGPETTPPPAPVFVPWLIYHATSTVLGFALSVLLGILVGGIALAGQRQFDPTSPWLVAVTLFALVPASWGPSVRS